MGVKVMSSNSAIDSDLDEGQSEFKASATMPEKEVLEDNSQTTISSAQTEKEIMSIESKKRNHVNHIVKRNMTRRIMFVITETPENLRLATLGAWRGKERGMAVIAGVFLASLVITTVLSYGVGLSQVFFSESLENEPFDAKLEFSKNPGEGVSGWTNNTSVMVDVCDELMLEFSQFADCTVVFGKQGVQGGSFFNEDFVYAQGLDLRVGYDAENFNWMNVTFDYPELRDAGPPNSENRAIRFLGPEAFDGVLADRLGESIIPGMGHWPTPEEMEESRGIIIPSQIASQAKAEVGDVLEELTFVYVSETRSSDGGSISEDDCAGEINAIQGIHVSFCQIPITVTNVTIMAIYEPWDLGNPTLTMNPVFSTWTVLEENDTKILMENDHVYLGVAIDRAQLPTSSTAEASDWLEAIGDEVMNGEYTSQNITLYHSDIVGGTITFLNIFLGLIQTFDYIIMIPIVVLSLSVLIYGLILSLEQRRREISIHRVIGADVKGLQKMVLLELTVMSSMAWLVGYLMAMAAVPIVLSSVGFMEFRQSDFVVNPALSFVSTLVTMITTLGLAIIFGRSRSRKFIEMEIEEGVKNTIQNAEPKTWLHWIAFSIGMLAVIDTWMEMNGSEDGLVSNFFVEGLLGIFGPFLLWIGGALLLGRVGAKGPLMMQFIFSKTALLRDIKRGLKGSGSAESVNRLAIIMILTLSIVTLAAVQGYTGTLVDERTTDMTVGADLSVTFEEGYNHSDAVAILEQIHGDSLSIKGTTVPVIILRTPDGEAITTYVVLDGNDDILKWNEQGLLGDDPVTILSELEGLTLVHGSEVDLEFDDEKVTELIWEEIEFNLVEGQSEDDFSLFSLLENYSQMMIADWTNLDLSGQDLSNRDFGLVDFSGSNLSGANLSGSNFSEALLFNTDFSYADMTNTNLRNAILYSTTQAQSTIQTFTGTNLDNSNLMGLFGIADLSEASSLQNVICPDTTHSTDTQCQNGLSLIPTPLAEPLLDTSSSLEITTIEHPLTLRSLGEHRFIPGVTTTLMDNSLIIGEDTWRAFVGNDTVDNHTAATWIFAIEDVKGDDLEALRATVAADSRVSSAIDWSSSHKEVERNGGLIFGTPGLLSLQFVVASIAAVASSFVFLSLVLNQRQKELAILQAIGASPNQVYRLVLFEILSIVMVSMALGVGLGIGLALSFNGFFEIFGFIFQIFGGSSTIVERQLVYPWFELGMVSLAVFAAVVMALFVTTRKALASDLASVLKGE